MGEELQVEQSCCMRAAGFLTAHNCPPRAAVNSSC